MFRFLIATSSALLFFLVTVTAASPPGEVPFAEFADDFVKNHGLPDIERDDRALAPLLVKGYVTVSIGIFDVWHPAYKLRDKTHAERFRIAATALVDLQEKWLEWASDSDSPRKVKRETTTLRTWIRTWKSLGTINRKIREKKGPDLPLLIETKEETADALANFANRVSRCVAPESEDFDKSRIVLILSPSREDFVGLGSFLGSLNPENKRILWHDGLALWTSYRRAGIHVLALEHPANFPGRGDITEGLDMNAREETGLVQHVVQNATEWMIAHCYGNSMLPALANGLAMNMVVALYDQNNVRSGGGSGGQKEGAISKFVPGGQSSGGRLPGRNADVHWRKKKGQGVFLKELRLAQKGGAKLTLKQYGAKRDKRAYFLLLSTQGVSDYAVGAPFLKGDHEREPVPRDYVEDFLEFHRAYRCAFTHWLLTKARPAKGGAAAKNLMRLLLRELPRRIVENDVGSDVGSEERRKPFGEVVEEVYGKPLTAADGAVKSLEWEFLDWLSKRG